MANDNYNLNQFWRLFSKDRSARLVLGTFNTNTSFSVFSDKSTGTKRPVVNAYLDMAACDKIVTLLHKLLESTPNTRLSFVQLRWDQEAKSNKISATLVFGKNDDGTYYVEASGPQQQEPILFPFVPIANTEVEGKSDSAAENSMFGVRALIRAIKDYIPTAELLSTWGMTFTKNKTNTSGGDNRGGSGSGGSGSIF